MRKNLIVACLVIAVAAPLTVQAQTPTVSSGSLDVETNDFWGKAVFQLVPSESSVVATCLADGSIKVTSANLRYRGAKGGSGGQSVVYEWTANLTSSGTRMNGKLKLVRSHCGPLGKCKFADSDEMTTKSGILDGTTLLTSGGPQTSDNFFEHPKTTHSWVAILTPCDSPETPDTPEKPTPDPEPTPLKVR